MKLDVLQVQQRKLEVVQSTQEWLLLTVNDTCYCDHCPENATCDFAFDPYNWSEQDDWCLAEK